MFTFLSRVFVLSLLFSNLYLIYKGFISSDSIGFLNGSSGPIIGFPLKWNEKLSYWYKEFGKYNPSPSVKKYYLVITASTNINYLLYKIKIIKKY